MLYLLCDYVNVVTGVAELFLFCFVWRPLAAGRGCEVGPPWRRHKVAGAAGMYCSDLLVGTSSLTQPKKVH